MCDIAQTTVIYISGAIIQDIFKSECTIEERQKFQGRQNKIVNMWLKNNKLKMSNMDHIRNQG